MIEETEKQEEKQASAKELNEIREIGKRLDQLHNTIGAMEVEKSQLIASTIDTRHKIEEKAKAIMTSAGIPEEELINYKISLDDGKIVSA